MLTCVLFLHVSSPISILRSKYYDYCKDFIRNKYYVFKQLLLGIVNMPLKKRSLNRQLHSIIFRKYQSMISNLTLFGPTHFITLLAILFGIVLILWIRKFYLGQYCLFISRILGSTILIIDYPWESFLPLHMCNITGFFWAYYFLKKKESYSIQLFILLDFRRC